MSESVVQRTNFLASKADASELRAVLASLLTDITAIRASIVGINAKLDADATVTDVNYGTLWNPAALNTTP